jgi:hypothetical protein
LSDVGNGGLRFAKPPYEFTFSRPASIANDLFSPRCGEAHALFSKMGLQLHGAPLKIERLWIGERSLPFKR